MAAGRRYLNLNVYLRNSGYHEAAWRVSAADPASVLDPRHYVGLAAIAERGVLDSIFLPDSPGVAHFRSEYLPGAGLDPLQLLSAVATVTEQIGLIATVSTTYSYPWDVARRLATLDFISHGRAGWNIVTTAEPAGQRGQLHGHHAERGGRLLRHHPGDRGAEAGPGRPGEQPRRARGVRVDDGVVQASQVGEVAPAELGAGRGLQGILQRGGLGVTTREQERQPRQDPDVPRLPAARHGLRAQAIPERHAGRDAGQRGEDRVGVPRRKRFPSGRRARLGQERVALR